MDVLSIHAKAAETVGGLIQLEICFADLASRIWHFHLAWSLGLLAGGTPRPFLLR